MALPFAIAAAAFLGVDHAVAATASGLLVLLNIWILSVLGPRLVSSVANEEFPVLWAVALVAKFVLLAGALVGLVQFLPPMGIAIGFVPLLVGTLATALQLAQEEPTTGEA